LVLRYDTGQRNAARVRRFLSDRVMLAATYVAIDGAGLHCFSDRWIVRLLLNEELVALRFGSGSRSPGSSGSGVLQRLWALKQGAKEPWQLVRFGGGENAHTVALKDLMVIVVEYDQPAALELFFWKEHCRVIERRPLGNPDIPRRTSSRWRSLCRPITWEILLGRKCSLRRVS